MNYLLLFFCVISLPVFGQNIKPNVPLDTIPNPVVIDSSHSNNGHMLLIDHCQQMPMFKGNLKKYIKTHIQYPEAERNAKISGIVYVSFIVEKDGSLNGIKILRGVKDGPGLDKEALRLVNEMPKWSPAMQNGKPCRCQFNLPIHFDLN